LVTLNLEKIFNPKSIALIGASDEEDSVGYTLMKNLTELGYKGRVFPVNIHKEEVLGLKAYQTVDQLPETVDLAIIAVPARFVPETVEQCGKARIIGIIIISAGFKEIGQEGKELEDKILQIKRKYDLRIIGPKCLGIIRLAS
jgi:acyl-CoA synthetase (NDP forming)